MRLFPEDWNGVLPYRVFGGNGRATAANLWSARLLVQDVFRRTLDGQTFKTERHELDDGTIIRVSVWDDVLGRRAYAEIHPAPSPVPIEQDYVVAHGYLDTTQDPLVGWTSASWIAVWTALGEDAPDNNMTRKLAGTDPPQSAYDWADDRPVGCCSGLGVDWAQALYGQRPPGFTVSGGRLTINGVGEPDYRGQLTLIRIGDEADQELVAARARLDGKVEIWETAVPAALAGYRAAVISAWSSLTDDERAMHSASLLAWTVPVGDAIELRAAGGVSGSTLVGGWGWSTAAAEDGCGAVMVTYSSSGNAYQTTLYEIVLTLVGADPLDPESWDVSFDTTASSEVGLDYGKGSGVWAEAPGSLTPIPMLRVGDIDDVGGSAIVWAYYDSDGVLHTITASDSGTSTTFFPRPDDIRPTICEAGLWRTIYDYSGTGANRRSWAIGDHQGSIGNNGYTLDTTAYSAGESAPDTDCVETGTPYPTWSGTDCFPADPVQYVAYKRRNGVKPTALTTHKGGGVINSAGCIVVSWRHRDGYWAARGEVVTGVADATTQQYYSNTALFQDIELYRAGLDGDSCPGCPDKCWNSAGTYDAVSSGMDMSMDYSDPPVDTPYNDRSLLVELIDARAGTINVASASASGADAMDWFGWDDLLFPAALDPPVLVPVAAVSAEGEYVIGESVSAYPELVKSDGWPPEDSDSRWGAQALPIGAG